MAEQFSYDHLITSFEREVTDKVVAGSTYMDAIVEFQAKHDIENRTVVRLLDFCKPIYANLLTECQNAKLVSHSDQAIIR